jgi:hypothetical protein
LSSNRRRDAHKRPADSFGDGAETYKLGEDCLERAVQARKSEDSDAWLLIAKDWLLLAAESDAAKQQPGTSPQR